MKLLPPKFDLATGLLVAGGLGLAGWRHARGLEVVRWKLRVPGLGCPVRLVQLSDLHLEGFGRREKHLQRTVNALEADLICITGDLLSADAQLPAVERLLGGLRARVGKFAVTGNNEHENHVDLSAFAATLDRAGTQLLCNEAAAPVCNLALLGVDDPLKGAPDLAKTAASAPAEAFKVWLVHSPHLAPRVAAFGGGLMLSGHTHGGQFRLPGGFAPVVRTPFLSRRHAAGFWRQGPLLVYVSRGYGASLLPVRTFCRHEVTLFELTSA